MKKCFFAVVLFLFCLTHTQAGAVNGPLMSPPNLILPAGGSHSWPVLFRADEMAEVYLVGQGFNELTLEVYDRDNKLVATGVWWKNEGPGKDWYAAFFTPPVMDYYRIVARNKTAVPNDIIIGVR